jgi:hypothetical protein
MRRGGELSADEILGEPDQVVVHAHPLGRIHQQRRNAAPPPRFARRDLVDQRDAAAPESW